MDVIRRGEAELHGARAELRTPRNGSPIAEMGLREELIDELGERDDDDDDAKS